MKQAARIGIAALSAVLLAGCVRPGADNAMTFQCPDLGRFSAAYDTSPLPEMSVPEAALAETVSVNPLTAALGGITERRALTGDTILALSGGGAWGAFGSGFLRGQAETAQLPHFDAITAVSTGAMQSVFVAIGDYAGLQRAYAVAAETQLLHSTGTIGLLTKGSQYTLEPLRQWVGDHVCADGCRLLRDGTALTRAPILIGMVKASSGAFEVVNFSALMRQMFADQRPAEEIKNCATGILLASSAQPVVFQRIKIASNDAQGVSHAEVFYDGGVRLSLFDQLNTEALDQRERARPNRSPGANSGGQIYALRNGPLKISPDAAIDENGDAFHAVKRGYGIVVNQIERNSVALLRLARPRGSVHFISADGFDPAPYAAACGALPAGTFFNPAKMCALDRYGYSLRFSPAWRELR